MRKVNSVWTLNWNTNLSKNYELRITNLLATESHRLSLNKKREKGISYFLVFLLCFFCEVLWLMSFQSAIGSMFSSQYIDRRTPSGDGNKNQQSEQVLSPQEVVTKIDYYLDGELVTDEAILEELRQRTEQNTNEPISRYKIRKSIENIYLLGDYSHIAVERADAEQALLLRTNVKLKFWLKSKIRIKDIEIEGNNNVSRRKILSAIKSNVGGEYVKSVVQEDIKKIEEVYKKHGYFKSVVKLLPPETDERGKISIEFSIKEKRRASLKPIKFIGNLSISDKTLLKQMKTDKDRGYNYEILKADIERLKKLYREKKYLTVEIEEPKLAYDLKENALDITILIHEGPKLIVRFIGEDIDRGKLKKQIALYRRNNYNRFTLQKSAAEIESFYEEKGYYNVKVNYEIRDAEQALLLRKVTIEFKIDKGKLLTIAKISFEGNHRFSDSELKEKMETKGKSRFALPGLRWLFHRGLFDKEQFENDLRAIKIFYKQHGYREVRVDYEKPIEIREERLYIKIQIYEGPQTLIDQVVLQGNEVFKSEDIKPVLKAKEGEPYNEELLLRDMAFLYSLYDEKGYIYANIKPVIQSEKTQTKLCYSNLVYYINEGKQAKVGKMRFSGTEKTNESVLKREFRNFGIVTGETLNLKKLNQCHQRLYTLGLFKTVRFDIPGRTERNEVLDINVTVAERNPGTINVSGGYSPSEGIRGTFEIAYNNLYGRGMRIGTKLRIGTRGNLYEGRLREPYFLNTRTQLTLRAFQDNLKEKENIRATGGTVNLAKLMGLYNNISLEYKYQDLRSTGPELKTTVSSVSVGLNRDTRNPFLSPSQGGLHNVVFEYAGGLLGGEASFAKFTTTNKFYKSIKDNTVLALALRTGYEEGLRSYRKKEIISFERFFAGGSTTVRGYSERLFGPGDVMFIFNAELRFPISKWLRGVTFFDSGTVWDKLIFSEIKDNPPKSAVGLGVRVDTPIGPVRVDYGYPINRVKDKGFPGELYIALGHAF